ncbi:MAG: CBS domain-containing protein [Pseudomonadales bacterium]
MLRSVDLKDYVQQDPITISPQSNLLEAVQLILLHKISGVCVVDEKKQLLGILSELDCLRGILGATYNQSGVGQVSEYMTTEIDVATLGEDIINVANEMMAKQQRRRPVVEGGKLIGQITCRQLLNAVKEFSDLEKLHTHK